MRAGAETTFVCALGDDAGGRWARDLAAGDGLDLRAQASDEPTGTAGIYVDTHGRNTIVIGAGANAALSTDHVDAQSAVLAAAGVVLAGIALALLLFATWRARVAPLRLIAAVVQLAANASMGNGHGVLGLETGILGRRQSRRTSGSRRSGRSPA